MDNKEIYSVPRTINIFARFSSYIISFILFLVFPLTWSSPIPEAKYTSVCILLGLGIYWLFLRLRSNRDFRLPKILIPLFLFILLQLVELIFTPIPRQFSFNRIIDDLAILVIFVFCLDSLYYHRESGTWQNSFVSVGILFAIVELLAILYRYKGWTQVSGSLVSIPPVSFRTPSVFLGHPNIMAGFINILVFIVLIKYFAQDNRLPRISLLVLLILFLTVDYFTSSRGGWLGLVIGLLTSFFLINVRHFRTVCQSKFDIIKQNIDSSFYWISAIILSVGMIIPLVVRQIKLVPHGSISVRFDIWRYAWNIFLSSPILGNGIGAYSYLYPLVSHESSGDNLVHAHNFLLQIAVETGILGLILAFWIALCVMTAAISCWRKGIAEDVSRIRLSLYIGALVALAVHQLFDYLFSSFIFSISFFIFFAFFLYEVFDQNFFVLSKKLGIPIMIALVGIVPVSRLGTLSGEKLHAKGVEDAYREDWVSARDSICEASNVDLLNTLLDFQCGLANAYVAYSESDAEGMDQAILYTTRGLAADPFWYVHWANLASYEWERGNNSEALLYMRRAVDASPRDATMQLNLAWMEEKLGNPKSAVNSYNKAICLYPWLIDNIYLNHSSLLTEFVNSDCPEEYDYSLLKTENEYLIEGWIAFRSNDFEKAKIELHQALGENPHAALAYVYLGLIEQRNGNFQEAWRNVKTSLYLNNNSLQILLIASQIAFEQEKKLEAIELLDKAFSIYLSHNNSEKFYYSAYREEYLPVDRSPFLRRIDLTSDILEGFRKLAEYHKTVGDYQRYEHILSTIDHIPSP
jgi:putative inorganic carbon (HCO3(-)) transporter